MTKNRLAREDERKKEEGRCVKEMVRDGTNSANNVQPRECLVALKLSPGSFDSTKSDLRTNLFKRRGNDENPQSIHSAKEIKGVDHSAKESLVVDSATLGSKKDDQGSAKGDGVHLAKPKEEARGERVKPKSDEGGHGATKEGSPRSVDPLGKPNGPNANAKSKETRKANSRKVWTNSIGGVHENLKVVDMNAGRKVNRFYVH